MESKTKSFWKKGQHSYRDLLDLNEEQLILLLNGLTREDIIEWLKWNDPNGIYDDVQSLKELGRLLSEEEGLEIILRQVEENRI